MKKYIIIIVSIFCFTNLPAQKLPPKSDILFFEDFNGKTLDRKKWNVEITGNTVNNEQQAYVDSSITLNLVHGKSAEGAKNGALVIKAVFHPDFTTKEKKHYDFLSGRINTRSKFEFTYGSAFARMKMSAGAGDLILMARPSEPAGYRLALHVRPHVPPAHKGRTKPVSRGRVHPRCRDAEP